MKNLKIAMSVILFTFITSLGIQSISSSRANQELKKEYAELNHYKHGIFSVDGWKEQLSNIIYIEIDKLSLIRKNKPILKQHLEVQLGILIDKVYGRIKKKYKRRPIKRFMFKSIVDLKEIKKGIPEYAEAMMAELSQTKNENELKRLLKARIKHYMAKTYDPNKKSHQNIVIQSEEVSKERLQNAIKINHQVILRYAQLMIGMALIIFIMEGLTKGPLIPIQYTVLTLTLLVMLIVGVTTPMLDLEAKIEHLEFVLFGNPIKFEDQVIYYQSKSILDIFNIMIHHRKLEMKFVGVLLVSFSIIFPLLKLFSSFAYYYNFRRVRESRVIQFFALKSGKWSMADVLVVAIFMAYIGLTEIFTTQLNKLEATYPETGMLTTNGTNLRSGYFVFVAYTLFAIFLSSFVQQALSK